MKTFLNSVSNKFKAIYVVWVFSHIILLVFGILNSITHPVVFYGSRGSSYYDIQTSIEEFWPFIWNRQGDWAPHINHYDITEFIIYVFSPLILSYAIWLFKKKSC